MSEVCPGGGGGGSVVQRGLTVLGLPGPCPYKDGQPFAKMDCSYSNRWTFPLGTDGLPRIYGMSLFQ